MKINILKCKHCKHEWIQRVERKPKTCPACKSYNWNKKPQLKYRRKND